MKKWALPLSLAVALAANSAAALAATDPIATNFRGHFKTQLQYNSKEVNEDIINGPMGGGDHHLPTGAFGAVDVDLRGDIVLSPNAQNRFVLELRQRIRGDKLLDAFPLRFSSSGQSAHFGGGASGGRFTPGTDSLVDKAYLENKSAWWADGPEITTRIGKQDPNYNPWVGRFIGRLDRNGVTVEGFKLGPAELKIGYIWGGGTAAKPHKLDRTAVTIGAAPSPVTFKDYSNVQSLILSTNIPVESAKLSLTGVRTAATGLDKAIIDYHAGLNVPLSDTVSLDGNFARDALHEASAYNVQIGAKIGVANLSARYRSVQKGFSPFYEHREDIMTPEKRTESQVHDERTGFTIAMDGEVHNWKLSGSFDSSYREWLGRTKDEKIDTIKLGASTRFSTVDFSASATIEKSKEDRSVASWVRESATGPWYRVGPKNDKNTYTVGLGTNFDIVRATYELKLTDEKKAAGDEKRTTHTIALAAPVKVAYLDTLHLGANVALRSGDLNGRASTGWGVDVAWQGDNGLRAGIHYTKGYNGELENRQWDDAGNVTMRTANPDELRKYVYPDGTTHYLGNGLAVTAGWGINF